MHCPILFALSAVGASDVQLRSMITIKKPSWWRFIWERPAGSVAGAASSGRMGRWCLWLTDRLIRLIYLSHKRPLLKTGARRQ